LQRDILSPAGVADRMKEQKKKRKNFKELFMSYNLNGISPWTQTDCSNCPNTPLKIAIGKS